MKIILETPDAGALKQDIINAASKNVLKTWSTRKVANSGDVVLTHSTSSMQWNDDVLIQLVPKASQNFYDTLEAEVVWWEGKPEPPENVKSYILGRFTEILLAHFRDDIVKFEIKW